MLINFHGNWGFFIFPPDRNVLISQVFIVPLVLSYLLTTEIYIFHHLEALLMLFHDMLHSKKSFNVIVDL